MRREIEKILEFTAIAPSSHNTQPWAVSVKGNTIHLYADFSRSLHFSDPENRELYISLGAALQNTLYAIKGLGFGYKFKYFPKSDNELVAAISVNLAGDGKLDEETLVAMRNRHSNRNAYEKKEIPKSVAASWKELIKDLGVELNAVSGKKEKSKIAELVSAGTLEAMANKGFKDELSKWVRHNLTRSHDGMPGYGMSMPTILSFFSPLAIKNFNIGPQQAKLEKSLINFSSAVVIISGKNDVLNWVKAGQAYERVILDATKRNIKSSTTAAAVEIGDNYKKLMQILNSRKRPLVMFKLGYCDKVPKPTPKRTVQELLKV